MVIACSLAASSFLHGSDKSLDRCADLAIRDVERGICHIHGVRLREHQLAINAAIEITDPEERSYDNWQVCHFPHAPLFASGSDLISEWPPKATNRVWSCERCRKARNEWTAKNRGNKIAEYIMAHLDA